MEAVIFEPLEAYAGKYAALHAENTRQFFEELVRRSGVDIEQNRETVKQYRAQKEYFASLQKKLNLLRFLRVLFCICVVLIPLVILRTTPKIKQLRVQIAEADARADKLLAEANAQMRPLHSLFSDSDALRLIESTVPHLTFASCFSAKQEADMKINYDFCEPNEREQSTIDVLAGSYNDNPFLFENKLIHSMGVETYHGSKVIHWTETYRDSDGRHRTRSRSQTLHATVTRPKPFYRTQVVLHYCAQAAPDLCFSRDATHLEQKSEKAVEGYIKRGEKKLRRRAEKAVRENDDFTSMANTDFEVLFDALDRTDEVQFRALFTPLAQTNMVELLLSKTGYGDDFHFLKIKRTNRILSNHSQGRPINLTPRDYASYSFDQTRDNFLGKNAEFFKAVYFDFAPLWAIPAYQERPVHSLKPIPDAAQLYAAKECEALANAVDRRYVVHPQTKTQAILKSEFVASSDSVDETCVTAYSYDIARRVELVSVYGEDGHYHDVPVEWDEYLPLEAKNNFLIAADGIAADKAGMASRNGLRIFQS